MKQLDVTDDAVSLRDAVHSLDREPAAVLQNGRPIAVLLPVEGADLETVALKPESAVSRDPGPIRGPATAEGGVSGEEMRRASPPGFAAGKGQTQRRPRKPRRPRLRKNRKTSRGKHPYNEE